MTELNNLRHTFELIHGMHEVNNFIFDLDVLSERLATFKLNRDEASADELYAAFDTLMHDAKYAMKELDELSFYPEDEE